MVVILLPVASLRNKSQMQKLCCAANRCFRFVLRRTSKSLRIEVKAGRNPNCRCTHERVSLLRRNELIIPAEQNKYLRYLHSITKNVY